MKEQTAPKRRGRPRGGSGGGRVRDFPALLVRLPPSIHEILKVVAEVRRVSRASVLADAILLYESNYLRDRVPEVAAQVRKILNSRAQLGAAREPTRSEIDS